MSQEDLEVLRGMNAAFSAGDVDAAVTYFAEGAIAYQWYH